MGAHVQDPGVGVRAVPARGDAAADEGSPAQARGAGGGPGRHGEPGRGRGRRLAVRLHRRQSEPRHQVMNDYILTETGPQIGLFLSFLR